MNHDTVQLYELALSAAELEKRIGFMTKSPTAVKMFAKYTIKKIGRIQLR